MFKVFPAHNKIPIKGMDGWQQKATTDPETIAMWANLYRNQFTQWGVPTGPTNGILVLDVDVKGNGFETLKNYPVPATLCQRTPSGGAHFIFKYPTDGHHYGNRVKFLPGLDSRGVGGYIIWYGADPAAIADAPAWLLEQLIAVAPPGPVGASIKVSPGIAEGIVLKSLEAIRNAPEGESNNVLNTEAFRLGQLVASESITREYAQLALTRAALERGKPPYEAKATIASGLDGGSKKPLTSPFGESAPKPSFALPAVPVRERWTPLRFDLADLHNTSKLRKPQLFENWSSEDIHLTTADGGTGKTTMKLFEAICLALGERFLGFRCLSPGRTLFITGEDTDKKLAAILGQILRQMGLLDDPQYSDKVLLVQDSIVIKKDADLCLIVKDRATGFLNPNHDAMRKLIEAIEDIRPKMIVFDPISSFWGSEAALNDMSKAVAKFMSTLVDHSGACVEMINHMGKQSSNQKDMTQFAGRGGTGLPSNARVSRGLRTVFGDEYTELCGETLSDKQSAILCNVNKFTDGSPLYNKPFLILRDGYLFSRKPLTDAKAREAEKQLTDGERVFAFVKECRQRDNFPSQGYILAHFAACGDPIPQARVKRAIEILVNEGHMGDRIKLVDNPDMTAKDKVFVITDLQGRE